MLVRGSNNVVVNRVLAKLNFEFEAANAWKRPPTAGLVMDHIYGAQLSDRRNTVLYLHYTTVKEHTNPNIPSTLVQSLGLTG